MQSAGLKSPRRSTNNNNQTFHIYGDFQPKYFTDFQADSLSPNVPAKVAKIKKQSKRVGEPDQYVHQTEGPAVFVLSSSKRVVDVS